MWKSERGAICVRNKKKTVGPHEISTWMEKPEIRHRLVVAKHLETTRATHTIVVGVKLGDTYVFLRLLPFNLSQEVIQEALDLIHIWRRLIPPAPPIRRSGWSASSPTNKQGLGIGCSP